MRNVSRVERLRNDLKILSISIGFLGIVYFFFIVAPIFSYIILENSLDVFYNTVDSDPEKAQAMVDQIIKNLVCYTISVLASISLLVLTILIISRHSRRILKLFDMEQSCKLLKILEICILIITIILIVLDSLLTISTIGAFRNYLLELAQGEHQSTWRDPRYILL